MKRLAMLTAAILFGLGANLAMAQDKVDLKLKWTPGTYVMETVQNSKTKTTMADMNHTVEGSQKMMMAIELEVEQPSAGSQAIHMTYRRVQVDQESGGRKMSYDSMIKDEQAGNPTAGIFGALIDQKITLILDPSGEVKEVKGAKELSERIAKANPMIAQMSGLSDMFGEAMFKQFAQQAKTLPGKPVAKGESWPVKMEMDLPMLGKIMVDQTCTLKDLATVGGAQVATIAFEGKMTNKEATQPATGAANMKFEKMDLKMNGESKFNNDLGMFSASDANVAGTMDMAMEIPAQDGGEPKTMKMSVDMDSTTSMKMKSGKYEAPSTATAPAPAPAGGDTL